VTKAMSVYVRLFKLTLRAGGARAEWPEAMKREMQACRTTEQQRVWSEKWAEHLAGRVASDGTPLRPSGGVTGAGGGSQPS
jgi:hypothetical protein